MGLFLDLLGTLRDTLRIKRATLDASGLTAARTYTLPDAAGTFAMVADMLPHKGLVGDPYTLVNKVVRYTTAQTGSAVWTPASGKKLVVTKLQVQNGGTTAGELQLWFGASGDTTYSRGTDYAIFDGEFAPSATLKPGVVDDGPWIADAADRVLRVTTSAAINPCTINVWGYEI